MYAKKKVEEIDDLETEFYNTTGIVWDDTLLDTSDTGNLSWFVVHSLILIAIWFKTDSTLRSF